MFEVGLESTLFGLVVGFLDAAKVFLDGWGGGLTLEIARLEMARFSMGTIEQRWKLETADEPS